MIRCVIIMNYSDFLHVTAFFSFKPVKALETDIDCMEHRRRRKHEHRRRRKYWTKMAKLTWTTILLLPHRVVHPCFVTCYHIIYKNLISIRRYYITFKKCFFRNIAISNRFVTDCGLIPFTFVSQEVLTTPWCILNFLSKIIWCQHLQVAYAIEYDSGHSKSNFHKTRFCNLIVCSLERCVTFLIIFGGCVPQIWNKHFAGHILFSSDFVCLFKL